MSPLAHNPRSPLSVFKDVLELVYLKRELEARHVVAHARREGHVRVGVHVIVVVTDIRAEFPAT